MTHELSAGGAHSGDSAAAHRAGNTRQPTRLVSFATGLPWHIASRNKDRQLLSAAKKGNLHAISRPEQGKQGSDELSAHDDEHDEREQAGFLLSMMPGVDEAGISVESALKRGADVNAADFDGNTALHYACEEGYQELTEFLLAREDISINCTATMDWTPLHCASSKGRVEAILVLAKRGCDIHLLTRDGNSALHLAAMGGHLEALKVLVDLGCDTVIRNHNKQTAANLAMLFRNGQYETIVEHLAEYVSIPSPMRQTHLQDKFALRIRLVEGTNISSRDMVGNSDPYCALCVHNPPGSVRSKTIKNSKSPCWDQILLLRINLAPQLLLIELWDDDFGKSQDDFIGKGAVNLSGLVASTKAYFSKKVNDENGEHVDKNCHHPESCIEVEMKSRKHVHGVVTLELKILRIPDRL